MIGKCKVHDTDRKPDACKNFPTDVGELRELPDCAYWFDKDGVRHGECAACGVCCLRPWIYIKEFDKKFEDEPCPYLVKNGN